MFSQRSSAAKRPGTSLLSPFVGAARTAYGQQTPRASATPRRGPARVVGETEHFRIDQVLSFPIRLKEVLSKLEARQLQACQFEGSGELGLSWLSIPQQRGQTRIITWIMGTETCTELLLPKNFLTSTRCICATAPLHQGGRPGLLAVSSDGKIMHWPDVTEERTLSLQVGFDEANDKAIGMSSCGDSFALASTFGLLFVVHVRTVTGRSALSISRLWKPSDGNVLAGFGRKMTSLFGFAATKDTPFTICTASGVSPDGEHRYLSVLTKQSVQVWNMVPEENQLLIEVDLLDSNWQPSEELHQALITHQIPATNIELIDTRWCTNRDAAIVLIRAAGKFLLGLISTEGALSFFSVTPDAAFAIDTECDGRLLRLLVPPPSSVEEYVFLYHELSQHVLPISLTSEEPLSTISLGGSGRRAILGSAVMEGIAVIYSGQHSGTLLGLMPKDSPAAVGPGGNSVLDDSFAVQPAAIAKFAHSPENMEATAQFLSAAFESFTATETIDVGMISQLQTAPGLDQCILRLSTDIIDATPKFDPRWSEAPDFKTGISPTSLIILQQLDDKQRHHNLLLSLIMSETPAGSLYGAMSTMGYKGDTVSSRDLLLEHSEKIAAISALRRHQNQTNYQVVTLAIQNVVAKRHQNVNQASGLTPEDVFYRNVCALCDFIPVLVGSGLQLLGTIHGMDRGAMPARIETINAVNESIHVIFQQVGDVKRTNQELYTQNKDVSYLKPWLCDADIRAALSKQINVVLEHVALDTAVLHRERLFQQIHILGDFLLEGFVSEVDNLKLRNQMAEAEVVTREFVQQRAHVISSFMEHESQYALVLAEKFRDYKTLAVICEKTGDKDKLDRLTAKFGSEFTEAVFSHYMEEGKRTKLLEQPAQQNLALDKFLESHESLRWLHQINTHSFVEAHETLASLADDESRIFPRKKTLWSLSKLAVLAADPDENTRDRLAVCDRQLSLLGYQEQLPVEVLQEFHSRESSTDMATNKDFIRPLTPEEMIQLFISIEAGQQSEIYFIYALEILFLFVAASSDLATVTDLKLQILSASIIRDENRWKSLVGKEPLEGIKQTIFYLTLAEAIRRGMPSKEVVNVGELLACTQLTNAGAWTQDATFKHHVGIAGELSTAS